MRAGLAEERAEQGFGPHVADPAVLARIADLVLGNDDVRVATPDVTATFSSSPTPLREEAL